LLSGEMAEILGDRRTHETPESDDNSL
jgi:hypothetical protein